MEFKAIPPIKGREREREQLCRRKCFRIHRSYSAHAKGGNKTQIYFPKKKKAIYISARFRHHGEERSSAPAAQFQQREDQNLRVYYHSPGSESLFFWIIHFIKKPAVFLSIKRLKMIGTPGRELINCLRPIEESLNLSVSNAASLVQRSACVYIYIKAREGSSGFGPGMMWISIRRM